MKSVTCYSTGVIGTVLVGTAISATLNSGSVKSCLLEHPNLAFAFPFAESPTTAEVRSAPSGSDLGDEPQWPRLCESQFRWEAQNAPSRLISRIESGELDETLLTFAAEALGIVTNHADAVRALVDLMKHDSAIVREGAIYGLIGQLDRADEAREVLKHVAESDPSKLLRAIAADTLA